MLVLDTAGLAVVRFLVSRYIQDDPSPVGVLSEYMADRVADKLAGKTVKALLPEEETELPAANFDDAIVEVAALMARLRCPARRNRLGAASWSG